MGFRFRKSLKIAPGIKLNIGKKGISSVSIGGRGATVNINRKGTRSTIGLPGTGLSHSSYKPHRDPNHTPPALADNPPIQDSQKTLSWITIALWLIVFAVLIALIF
ncbi:MAG: DUF4236 domain-containing protein [Moraxellaceae bacterium]|nr:MAG: DUF4236 domain-containing protein [Moraxellaceae bacterium]